MTYDYHMVSPAELKKALTEITATAAKAAVERLIGRCNVAVKTRIEEIRRDPLRKPNPVVTVNLGNEPDEVVTAAIGELRKVGYRATLGQNDGDDDGPGRYTPPSSWIEISV